MLSDLVHVCGSVWTFSWRVTRYPLLRCADISKIIHILFYLLSLKTWTFRQDCALFGTAYDVTAQFHSTAHNAGLVGWGQQYSGHQDTEHVLGGSAGLLATSKKRPEAQQTRMNVDNPRDSHLFGCLCRGPLPQRSWSIGIRLGQLWRGGRPFCRLCWVIFSVGRALIDVLSISFDRLRSFGASQPEVALKKSMFLQLCLNGGESRHLSPPLRSERSCNKSS